MPEPRHESPRSSSAPPAERPRPSARPRRGDDRWPRVEPSSDGRGKPPERRPMLPRQGRRAIVTIFVSLLALNVVFALVTGRPEQSRASRTARSSSSRSRRATSRTSPAKRRRSTADLKKPVDYKPQGADKTEKVDHFKTAGADVRQHRPADEAARGEGRRAQRAPAGQRTQPVPDVPARLRADDPDRRPADLADAPCGRRGRRGRARQLHALAARGAPRAATCA